ncbi:hypothetical protein [Microbispora sp. H10670]|uniref:hypothetical protein n=1 Tax=Microbispora sp. H10670 TaxID=2729108 RepID=UPI001602B191|nr:hypothetical protein [Microbispora sp. H10670]
MGQNVMVPEIASQPPAAGQGYRPPPQAGTQTTREDLRAVIAARRDLGPEYEDALVDSFLDKLDVEIAARVRNEVAAQIGHQPLPGRRPKDSAVGVALGSLGIGIPLTGIAAGTAHGPGLLLAWGGIVAVNLAYALSRRTQR